MSHISLVEPDNCRHIAILVAVTNVIEESHAVFEVIWAPRNCSGPRRWYSVSVYSEGFTRQRRHVADDRALKAALGRHTVEEHQGSLPKDDRQVVPGDSRTILRTTVLRVCLGLYWSVLLVADYCSCRVLALPNVSSPACTTAD